MADLIRKRLLAFVGGPLPLSVTPEELSPVWQPNPEHTTDREDPGRQRASSVCSRRSRDFRITKRKSVCRRASESKQQREGCLG